MKARAPGRREPKKKAAEKKRGTSESQSQRTLSHPLFGDIPLIEVTRTDPSGKTWRYHDYDPDYRPAIPPGGVAGDIRRQSYCIMCHAPRYFYLDETRRCVQCGADFVFGAAEQKFWYETLKFHFDSTAIRCPACRKKRRSDRFLRTHLEQASHACTEKPDDPFALLAFAEAILHYFQRFGQGDLNRAIAACRRARKLSPTMQQASDLESRLQTERRHQT